MKKVSCITEFETMVNGQEMQHYLLCLFQEAWYVIPIVIMQRQIQCRP